MSSTSSNSIFDANPYETHPSLTSLEAEVLWEYAKLAQHIKMVWHDIFYFDFQVTVIEDKPENALTWGGTR